MATLTTSYQLIKTGDSQQFGYATGYLQIYAKYNSQDKANNTTSVSYRLNLVVSGGYIGDYNGNKPVVINGTTSSQTTYIGNDNYYSRELATYTETITHNQDGTKSGTCSGSVNFTGWQTTLTTGTGNFDLPAIPRASKLTSATMNIANNGNSITVTPVLTKNVNTYYDCLVIQDNGVTKATLDGVTSNTAKSLSSSQITDIYNAIGTATNKTFTCYLATYSDNTKATLIGNSTSVNLTATLPTYNISITSSVTDSVSTYNTYKPNSSTFIANLSKPTFTFSATSSTGSYYGRTPTFTLNDVSVTSPCIENNYTGQIFTLKVTDGRKTATNTPTMTHVAYFTPTLQTTVTRTTPTGSTIDVQVNGTYYSGTGLTNLATPTLTLKYTQSGGSEQTTTITLTTSTSGNVVTFTGTKQLTGMNYQKSVTWNTTISDKLGVTQTNSNVLSQGLPVWNAYRKNDTNYMNINGELSATGNIQTGESITHNGTPILRYNGDTNKNTILSSKGGTMYLRPNGDTSTSKEASLDTSGNLGIQGYIKADNGIYSRETGSVGTPVGNGKLIIKRATNAEAPNNGVVLEYGNSTNWTGQLYIGDNATQGIWFNGWSNGSRGTWKKLMEEPTVGTSGMWRYRKWSDGTAELWGVTSKLTFDIATSWGNLYESPELSSNISAFPFTFVEAPHAEISITEGNYNYLSIERGSTNTTNILQVYLTRPTIQRGFTCKLNIYVTGKWK